MPHQDERGSGNTPTTRADLLRARQRINLGIKPLDSHVFGQSRKEEGQLKSALRVHQRAFRRRRTSFRETQGLFTTGLNLSRLRALSSIR